jgi:group II intron reverse transcriptase/maturase
MAFTSLNPALDLDLLREAYRRTRKDGATGIDGQTAADYAQDLEANLQSLLDRAKSGERYRAPPVRRVHIPKDKPGETRPLGIPTFEDKVLQRAVAMILEAIYEQDFCAFSYGFRAGRSAHDLLETFRNRIMSMHGGWVLEADIRRFFDTVDHAQMRAVLRKRVRDGVILRLIGKWLHAGVMEDGRVSYPTAGTPQGGVISPMLANILLHEVLDAWWVQEVAPRLRGTGHLYRYADDFVAVFSSEEDARRVMAVLPKRFAKYGLTIHPDKTRLIHFEPPRNDGSGPKPGTFDLLGFTHRWGRSRKGNWVVQQVTASSRLRRGLHRISAWLAKVRHCEVRWQSRALARKLQGHYAYYGVTGNGRRLVSFRREALRMWRHWLCRRSQRAHMPWDRFRQLLSHHPVPPARVVRSIYRPT